MKVLSFIFIILLSNQNWSQYDFGNLMTQQFYIESYNLKQRTEYIIDSLNNKTITHIERYNDSGNCYEERFLDNKHLYRHITTTYTEMNQIKNRTIIHDDTIIIKEDYLNGKINYEQEDNRVFTYYKYDNEGLIIQEEKFIVKSHLDTVINRKMTSYGFLKSYLIKEVRHSNSAKYKPVFSNINTYNETGNLTTFSHFNFSNVGDSSIYEKRNYYYNNGNLIKLEEIIHQGFEQIDSTLKTLYYNATGKLDSLKTINGTTEYLEIWARNIKGKLVEYTSFRNGDVHFNIKYKYDEVGNIIEKKITEEDTAYTFFYLNLYK